MFGAAARGGCALVAALILSGACGGGSSGTKSSSATTTSRPTEAGAQTVAIQNFKFNPEPLNAKQGSKVTVAILDDGIPHSVTADDGSFDTGIFMKTNGPKTITVSKTGTIKYHCQVHSFMHGTIDAS